MTKRIREEEERIQGQLREKSVILPLSSKGSTNKRNSAERRAGDSSRSSKKGRTERREKGLRRTLRKKSGFERSTGRSTRRRGGAKLCLTST
jgi:hypothetical protein